MTKVWTYVSDKIKPVTTMLKVANSPGSGVEAFVGGGVGHDRMAVVNALRAVAAEIAIGRLPVGEKLVIFVEKA